MRFFARAPKKIVGAALLAASLIALYLLDAGGDLLLVFVVLGLAIAGLGWSLADTRRSLVAAVRGLERAAQSSHAQIAESVQQAVADASRRQSREEVRHWTTAVWAGHDQVAIPALRSIVADHGVPSQIRGKALMTIAKWHATRDELDLALQHMVVARLTCPGLVRAQGEQPALEADFLTLLGRKAESRAVLEGLAPADANILLRLADTHEDDDTRLDVINEIFRASGCTELAKRDLAAPLSLDNVTSKAPEVTGGPTVSVILPVRNSADTIETALRSLLEQSYVELEVIVVDDASNDATPRIVQEIAQRDPRIRIEALSKNRGAYGARNVGLRLASGDFITTHDGDDWSHPQKVESQVQVLLGDDSRVGTMGYAARVTDFLTTARFSVPKRAVVKPNHSSIMVRREVFEELGGWDEVRVAADGEFMLRCKAYYGDEALQLVRSDVPLMFARTRADSLTGASETSVFTVWREGGVRRRYHEAYQAWHASEAFREALPWREGDPRPFVCPDELRI